MLMTLVHRQVLFSMQDSMSGDWINAAQFEQRAFFTSGRLTFHILAFLLQKPLFGKAGVRGP